jgi:hypothetical protein
MSLQKFSVNFPELIQFPEVVGDEKGDIKDG